MADPEGVIHDTITHVVPAEATIPKESKGRLASCPAGLYRPERWFAVGLEREEGISVRPARSDDAAFINGLWKGADRADVSETKARLVALIKDPGEIIAVAEMDDRPVGFVHAGRTRTLYEDLGVDLVGLFVDTDHRGMGVGRVLMSVVEAWGRAIGAHEVQYECEQDWAGNFCRDFGYTIAPARDRCVKSLV